jgi:hypothetical protein
VNVAFKVEAAGEARCARGSINGEIANNWDKTTVQVPRPIAFTTWHAITGWSCVSSGPHSDVIYRIKSLGNPLPPPAMAYPPARTSRASSLAGGSCVHVDGQWERWVWLGSGVGARVPEDRKKLWQVAAHCGVSDHVAVGPRPGGTFL